MLTIAKLSYKETLYKRIFLITILMTLAYVLFYGIATHYAAKQIGDQLSNEIGAAQMEQQMLATQLIGVGLYFASFITALLSILATVGSIAGEIESHQIDTILSRPLHRRDVVLGKFIGLGGLLVIYAACLFIAILLVNLNFGGALHVSVPASSMLTGMLLFALQPLILIAVALWLSARMSTINGGIILIILYGIGFVGGFLEQIGQALNNHALVNIGIVSSLVFPLDSLFRRTMSQLFNSANDPLNIAAQGLFGSLAEPTTSMLIYTLLYGVVFLLFAMRKFSKRDL
ncbi:ABC transporter permease subunit [Tumebacillus permanentifrigoris]|uniref:ABC-type transport system involved in multi-copper enzyme maturation permease subunit n=1 Tax=Tumebacillus permanentifrigoris TaxID=378543 RepID=A0A316D5D0_9BACL|nr:ABC transporter permease subunit [Tumebacillus permanentifrigoris]PWK07856.1 ABC-type transport system involved in multi-copper enzyme maturation permease subunit [Tumebacillus permanentifrigoris]